MATLTGRRGRVCLATEPANSTVQGVTVAMHDPDAEDVAKAGRGDRDAAARLIGRHAPKLLTVARRMLANQAEAEDVLQDVFLKLWTHAARWQPGKAKFETWLYRVMLNQCYDRLRRRPYSAPGSGRRDGGRNRLGGGGAGTRQTLARKSRGRWSACPSARGRPSCCATSRTRQYRSGGNHEDLSVEALESLLARAAEACACSSRI